ncbi:MAG: S-layer homology domain-containing protein [Oscillospiraceae bacterium]|nr:S-layer homology domain-containing protein [Oscillospiraceae bacterium]
MADASAVTGFAGAWDGEKFVFAPQYLPARTVTFDPNGGTVPTPAAPTGTDGTLASLPTPSRDNYQFDGWFTDKSGGTKIETDTVFTADATVYAHWTYKGNPGSGNSGGGNPSGGNPSGGNPSGGNPGTSQPVEVVPPAESPLAEGSEGWRNPYKDVADADWFYGAVQFVAERGLMNGTAADRFTPGATMTRAMLVTTLYRLEGSPAVSGSSPFPDVKDGAWYADAILWASQNHVVDGYTSGAFGPDDVVTREQTVTILYRYAQSKGRDVSAAADLSRYGDAGQISGWALDAMKWAVAAEIVQGRTAGAVAPKGTSTRAETATLFKRYVDN